MDPVSRALIEIEETHRSVLPWAFLAFGLHAALAGGIFFLGRHQPRLMAAQLPTVSVRLIQEKKPRKIRASSPRPTVVPRAVPTPVPAPKKAVVPKVEPVGKKPSEKAMPTLESKSTPLPASTPAPSGPPGISRGGLSLGENQRDSVEGVPSDFQFTYYLERMLTLIESRWYEPPVSPGTSARARFTIETSGHLKGIVLESSSGNPAFDRAVLRALYAANPLPPLPPAYRKPSLTIHLNFKGHSR